MKPKVSFRQIALRSAMEYPFMLLFTILIFYYLPSTHGLIRGVAKKVQNAPSGGV